MEITENSKTLKFDANGLIPAIVQDHYTKEVLTLAYMNAETLALTIAEGRTVFWSRSRREIWRKGETSGNVQRVVSITADCDKDALVIDVVKSGPACHTCLLYTSYFLVKPSDVAIYVEHGAADIGIVGKDILTESGADVYELLDTGMGKCRMCVAGPAGFTDDESRALRVATKFVNIARDHYERRGRDIDIVKLNGSIELAPILGLSDVIVDIVETGTTLKENDLTVIEEFMPISARFIADVYKRQARSGPPAR